MPQHYYMLHELGHRLGLGHASMYRLDNATRAPADPMGPGLVEDSYTDKFDIMACCKGDYSLHHRYGLRGGMAWDMPARSCYFYY